VYKAAVVIPARALADLPGRPEPSRAGGQAGEGEWENKMVKKILNQKKIKQIAARETKTLINCLPAELRSRLAAVAVVLQSRPNKDQLAGGIESDCLGLFTGPSLRDGDEGAPLPPQIILYLENIWEEALDGGRSFREELRRTFLHELGHYLGLEEDDLAVRDVD